MPRLLRDILCIIETFHKYARADSDEAALTPAELKRLLEVELGDFLQPHVFHAVERKLNLLDIDRNGTISFEEFILTIFSLWELCYLDIQSLNSEQRQASNTEKTNSVDPGAIARSGQAIEGTLPGHGMTSSTQLGHEEGDAVGHNQVSPREDKKTPNLPGQAAEPSGPQSRHVEDDEQEAAQDGAVARDDRAHLRTSRPLEGSKQTSTVTEEIPPEEDRPLRRLSNAKVRDHFAEENVELQKEVAQSPPEDQDIATERGTEKGSKSQALSLQGEDETSSERARSPGQAAARKSSRTQELAEPVDANRRAETQEAGKGPDQAPPETANPDEPEADRRAPETRELSAQERAHEPSDQPAQSSPRNVPEAEREGDSIPEAQKKRQGETQPPALETQTQHGNSQELRGTSRERDADEGSSAQDLSSEEGNQNRPELEGKETRPAEGSRAKALVISQHSPSAEATPGARERRHDWAPLGEQSQEPSREPRPHNKPVGKEDSYEKKDFNSPATQNESSCEPPNSLAPETRELPIPEDSQSQGDPRGGSVQGDHRNNPGAQKHGVPDERSRAREVEVLSMQEEDVHRPGGQEPSAREHDGLGLGPRGVPGAAMEPDGHPEAQESTEEGDDRASPEAESSSGLDAGFPEQTSTVTLPGKEGSRKERKVHDSDREEDDNPGTQEATLKILGEDSSASPTTDQRKEDPATLEKEDESPQEPSEVDDPNSNE
uniref:trichohyalin-like protein 1 n=1 Tax=Jaculus jaculus TaxID=51337 RepID=UPI001E1AFCF9|nr:trichohyalin-like protein 1 [Jaculus jaculus]